MSGSKAFMQTVKASWILGLGESRDARSPQNGRVCPTANQSLPLRCPQQLQRPPSSPSPSPALSPSSSPSSQKRQPPRLQRPPPPKEQPPQQRPKRTAVTFMSLSEAADSLNGEGLFPKHERLLDLCDDVRVALRESRGLGERHVEIYEFLADMLKGEEGDSLAIDFETIRDARLDKLLADVMDAPGKSASAPSLPRKHQKRLHETRATAANLQRKWRARFRGDYFELDQGRYLALASTGLLRGVVYNAAGDDQLHWWKAQTKGTLSDIEGNLRFEPGHWWLNLACAHRDGIVNGTYETPTKGLYGVMAVPLITGREDPVDENTIKYVREGRLRNMHLTLISQVGKQIRILRGYRLNSAVAPRAGVRYDGLYTIRQFGIGLDATTQLYRVVLTLERAPGQRPIDAIHPVIPRPSQFDDWLLYQKLEGEMIRQNRGDAGFLDWKMQRAKEHVEREL